jgi:hypothetical protein
VDDTQLLQVRDTVIALNRILLELEQTNVIVVKLAKSDTNEKEDAILLEIALGLKSILDNIESNKELCGLLYQIGSDKMN